LEKLAVAIVLHKSPQLEDPDKEVQLRQQTHEAVHQIIKKERKQAMYHAIGAHLKPVGDYSTGIMRIVPVPPSGIDSATIDPKTWKGPWRSVTNPEEIGFYICQINRRQYNQVEKTHFGSGALANELYTVVTSPNVTEHLQDILARTTN
jgi:hypothetical protein